MNSLRRKLIFPPSPPAHQAVILFLFICSSSTRGVNGEVVVAENDNMATMKITEREALYFAIQGFVGKGWNGTDLYPDPCGWTPIQGISCDNLGGFWYVTELSIGPIHDNSLSCGQNAAFNPGLFQLTHLKSLTIFNCFTSPLTLTNTNIPCSSSFWGSLANTLESLEFRSNRALVGPIPPSFTTLKNIQSLILLDNGLTGQVPPDIGSLPKLKRLVISSNRLTGRIPSGIGNLTDLLILDLSRNSLSGSLPLNLGSLTSLLKLDLSANALAGEIPTSIGGLRRLRLLDLSRNRLTGGLARVFSSSSSASAAASASSSSSSSGGERGEGGAMESLEELAVSHNPELGREIEGVQWDSKTPHLAVMDLSNAGLRGRVPESLARMRKLRYLNLSNNRMTGRVPPAMADMESIGSLYLDGNRFEGELKFPDWFYGKMGRRLRAEGNPNLCLAEGQKPPVRLTGVKLCCCGGK